MTDTLWNRRRQRLLHLLVAVLLGTYLYSPLRTVPDATLAVQAVAFPALALSGLVLWKGAWLRGKLG